MIRKKLKKHGGGATSDGATSSSGAAQNQSLENIGLNLATSTQCRVIRLQVKVGDEVRVGLLLGTCAIEGTHKLVDLRSPGDGTVTEVLVDEGQSFDGATDSVIQIETCAHNVVSEGICVLCSRPVSDSTLAPGFEQRRDMATVNVEDGVRLRISREEALRIREDTVRRLFHSKRLSLVLDLDHTLLHCTDDDRAVELAQKAPQSARLYSFKLDGKTLILKLRPGLLSFLQTMKRQYFEMYVYTAGTRSYAKEVCKIIDPDGTVFGSRIVSRDDTPELGVDKDLTRLFPVDDTMVLVVDDRDVWSGVANLITCEPFVFFRGMHDVNNAGWTTLTGEEGSEEAGSSDTDPSNGGTGVPLSKSPLKEEEMDAGLARVESILKQVHGRFFYPREPLTVEQQLAGRGSDVKVLLREIKQGVLRKVVIAFDAEIAPRTREITPERYLEVLGYKARLCGATLVERVDHRTTHLVATGETELANYGKNKRIWVVQPEWLEKSEHFWQRVKEEPYSVFKVYGTSTKSPGASKDTEEFRSSAAAGGVAPTPSSSSGSTEEAQQETTIIEEEEEEDLEDFVAALQEDMKRQSD